jgi:hypothetical protein
MVKRLFRIESSFDFVMTLPQETFMRKFCIPAIAAAYLFAVPAIAATESTGAVAKTAPDAAQVEQDLHQDLTKAGYTDIHIMPGSFLVRAKDKHGQATEMMIGPYSITEVTAMNESGASTAAKKDEKSERVSPVAPANK